MDPVRIEQDDWEGYWTVWYVVAGEATCKAFHTGREATKFAKRVARWN